jgi:hypothetical protein
VRIPTSTNDVLHTMIACYDLPRIQYLVWDVETTSVHVIGACELPVCVFWILSPKNVCQRVTKIVDPTVHTCCFESPLAQMLHHSHMPDMSITLSNSNAKKDFFGLGCKFTRFPKALLMLSQTKRVQVLHVYCCNQTTSEFRPAFLTLVVTKIVQISNLKLPRETLSHLESNDMRKF